jgi:hypothetical protein
MPPRSAARAGPAVLLGGPASDPFFHAEPAALRDRLQQLGWNVPDGYSLATNLWRAEMRRREFIAGLGSAAAWPVVARVHRLPNLPGPSPRIASVLN